MHVLDCQNCVRLLLDVDGRIVNRIMLEPDADYDPSPFIVAPEEAEGEIGGTYIEGAYTPPSEDFDYKEFLSRYYNA